MMTDIVERLRATADMFELADAPHPVVLHMRAAADEIERLRSMVTPKPLDDKAPKDRVLIGVERPPYEDKTYYDIIHWREDQQEWMVEAGCDWNISPAPRLWAHWSASHYLDPLDLPGLPYWDPADDEDEGNEDMAQGET